MPASPSTVALRSGLRLSYAAQGQTSAPAVVLLPGPTDSWRSYQPVLDRLPLTVRAVAVSLRGHGDSDKPPAGYRVADLAADVPELLDALGLARAILVGHSASCLVARRVAIEHPDRVAGLVLEASPTTLAGEAGLREFVETVVAHLEDPIDPTFARSFVADTSSDALAPNLLDALVAEVSKVPARVWRETFTDVVHYDDREVLGRIVAPTLLVWGDADTLVGRDTQHELLRRLPDATLTVYDGVGHTPRWEDPGRFASDLAGFVARVCGGSPGNTDPQARKRRWVLRVQRGLNPPIKLLVWAGLVPGHVLIETRGRRTGTRRTTVVGMHRTGDTGWIVAEHGRHAGYVRNLEANDAVRIRSGRRWYPATARVVPDDDARARLKSFGRRSHAAAVRRFGTELTTIRVDFPGQRAARDADR